MSMTEQEMTEDLTRRGVEVVRLSALVTVQGLAHAHIQWYANVHAFSARLMAANTEYREGVEQKVIVALELRTKFYEFWTDTEKDAEYQSRVAEVHSYTRQLQELLDTRQPILQGVAA